MIVTVYCGDLPGKLRKAFPNEKILAFAGTRGDRAKIEAADDGRPLVLIGYSAGCHGVRELLGLRPAAVVTVDGTHTSLSGRPQTMPLAPWRELGERAKRGECLWIASHTFNTYVERMSEGPYGATVTGLRLALDELLPVPEAGHSPAITDRRTGDLCGGYVVASYRSAAADKKAHEIQIQQAAEYLCRSFLPPVLGPAKAPGLGWIGSVRERVLRPARGLAVDFARAVFDAPGETIGEHLAAVAARWLHVREASKNAGPEIDRWLARVGAASPNNWCAAFSTFAMREACAELGAKMPITGSAGAKATMAQFVQAKRWASVADVRAGKVRLRPGMVPVWHRGKPGAWTGHIGIVEAVTAEGFVSIEGNSGPNADRVARMSRRLDDPNLLGFGWID